MNTTNSINDQLDLDRTYIQRVDNKPNGVWYAHNNSWISWLRSNGMPDWINPHDYILDIDKSKILVLDSQKKFEWFNDNFLVKQDGIFGYIDWILVSQKYSGVEIPDYKSVRYCDVNGGYTCMFWAYGWDVSSGCIWDLSIIEMVTKI